MPSRDDERSSCFVLVDERDSAKRITLCIMPLGLLPGQSVIQARDTWIKDITFFKDKCQEKKRFMDIDSSDSDIIKRKKLEIEIEEQEESFTRVEERNQEEREKSIEGRVEETAKIAIQVREYNCK